MIDIWKVKGGGERRSECVGTSNREKFFGSVTRKKLIVPIVGNRGAPKGAAKFQNDNELSLKSILNKQ